MPDMYPEGEYDLAGFCVGAVERRDLIDGQSITEDDVVIGIASSGPHSNGYSLIRRVLEVAGNGDIDDKPAADCLLKPTRIYVKPVLALMQEIRIRGLAHITGGGITENLPRILPDGLHAEINTGSWRQGPVFDWIADAGRITTEEMRRTFNCGVGMAVVVPPEDAETALSTLASSGEKAWRLGRIATGSGGVRYI
jgi:phosphoribosylformylglycinamidine cyclo-ligase